MRSASAKPTATLSCVERGPVQLALTLLLFALFFLPVVQAQGKSVSSWQTLRQLSNEDLIAATQNESQDQVRAILTLAERNLNRDASATLEQLKQAEPMLTPGTDEASYAGALRCQALHRGGGGDEACEPYRESTPQVSEPIIQAFIHATRSYLLYRESRHPEALEQAYLTLHIAEQIDDPDLGAFANNAIGVHFTTRLLPRMALPHIESSWKYATEMAYPEYKGVVRINLAAAYAYLDRHEEATQMLKAELNSSELAPYPARRLVVESLLAISQAEQGRAAEAEIRLAATLTEIESSLLPDSMAYGLTALGITQLESGEPNGALNTLKEALAKTGQTLSSGLQHSRVQFILVPYAKALRLTGDLDGAKALLESVVGSIPGDEPNQLLVDASAELARTLSAQGDAQSALEASATSAKFAKQLTDKSFDYRLARLNAELERERRNDELALALEREQALRDRAERDAKFRNLSYVVGGLLLAIIYLWFTRRMQSRLAATERKANERLEEEVRTRTREVEDQMAERMQVEVERGQLNQQLVEGEKLRALGQLTAGVAHDFNNLMTVVSLTAEALRDGLAKDETQRKHFASDILTAAQSGAEITSSLLAYARKQALQPAETQLDELVLDAMPMLRNTLGERHILDAQLEPCRVLADQGQVTTAILNLLLNAREAMREGGTVSLSVMPIGDTAEIRVEDTGIGMTEKDLARAIEPFFTTKSVGEGSGLGLSMAFGFARQSGGNLELKSQPMRGTIAKLTLPLLKKDQAQMAKPALNTEATPQDLRALVVEDRPALLDVLERTLAMLGMEVTAVPTADEAWQHVETHGMPDLLVSDIMMPGALDGQELALRLQKLSPKLPIVLISGYSDNVDSDMTFLSKPFSMEQLKAAILEALSVSASPRAKAS